ncbi:MULTISPECIES: adenylate/guanylate cyclase domain-containing protein [unclassified Sporosarcina]|uniref:adenylate/guanylate cyclase domain-containing protein n=1 Tax=unclassified Sporosarcina TaxID=2647733 RepID=UPI000C16552D|nr:MULTISPECIES: adenylate/guanylate cyclase domain-containing protein [unclassified Sporosarcina]PID05160.1 hypothetical protein CSV66_11400 [Sporosarcina sp. P30]PID08359.1 hypothetical protein CSV65_11380 [Sporosarcina sp. P31]PID11423.1 hypothetical protein CSV64_11865 [Sporosarcina sp. P32b]
MKKLVTFREEQIVNLSLNAAWELLANTNELNKYVGIFPVNFAQFTEEDERIIRWADAKIFKMMSLKWKEHVSEWVRYSHYTLERHYIEGPFHSVFWTIRMVYISENETKIYLEGDFICKNLLGRIALRATIYPQLRRMITYAMEYAKTQGTKKPLGETRVELESTSLAHAISLLKGAYPNTDMIDALEHTICEGSNEEVSEMQPYRWARIHQFDRFASVELFLFANAVGLLDYDWNLMCPNCRVPKGKAAALKQLTDKVHCELCGVDFDLDFDRYVEMKFHVNAGIRKVSRDIYCINGPVETPHVLAQFKVAPQENKIIDWPKFNEVLRCRVLKYNDAIDMTNEVVEKAEIIYSAKGFLQTEIPDAKRFTIVNKTTKEIIVVFEKKDWDDEALTAREVTSLQLFRDLLGTEVLAPGLQIGVGHMSILFTDLKNSTRLYEEIGDAKAYSDVQKHFEYLTRCIRNHKGTIVKTIGDSVMGAFTSEHDAFDAALAIQRGISQLNQKLSQPVKIKVGFHTGSVIAVNANDLLDYFGGTVNKAARIQHQSTGGDVIIHRDVYDRLISERPEIGHLVGESFTAQLSGFDKEVQLQRFIIEEKTSHACGA